MRHWIWLACALSGCGAATPVSPGNGAASSAPVRQHDVESIDKTLKDTLAAMAARDAVAIAATLDADGKQGDEIERAQADRILAAGRLYEAMQVRFPGPEVSDALDAAGVPNPEDFYTFLYAKWEVKGSRATGLIDDRDRALPPMIKSGGVWRIHITPRGWPMEPNISIKRLKTERETIQSVTKLVDAGDLKTAEAVEEALIKAGLRTPEQAYRPAIVLEQPELSD